MPQAPLEQQDPLAPQVPLEQQDQPVPQAPPEQQDRSARQVRPVRQDQSGPLASLVLLEQPDQQARFQRAKSRNSCRITR